MKRKKAISLVVLVITIIVMIIIASATIISLDRTDIFDKSEEAVDKYSYVEEKDKIKVAVINATSIDGVNIDNLTETINNEFNSNWEFIKKTEDYCIVKIKSSQRMYEISIDGKLEDYERTIITDKNIFTYYDYTISGLSQYGKELLTSLAGKDVTIIIPDEFTAINRLYVDNATILNGLKDLVVEAPNVIELKDTVGFQNCKSLTGIYAPKLTQTPLSAFVNCTNLTDVYMPNITNIQLSCFANCSNLINVDVSGATTIGYGAFSSCKSLVDIKVPNVTTIGGRAFTNCTSLKNIDIPRAITISDERAFEHCTNLINVNMPSVTNIGARTFFECTSLKSVNSPNLTTIGGNAFRECTKLSSIDLSKVTTIYGQYIFYNCKSLTSIDLSSIQTIGDFVFYNCNNIKTINYAGTMEEWKQVSSNKR